MNIEELDAYNLDDAVKFHDRLNPRLWDDGEQLLPEVRSKLLEIAADFEEFLGLNDVSVQDITISGSNAAYSYTDHSDIDLHLVVSMPQGAGAEVYRELFDAKKYQYNDLHDIRIGGADVELYVQDADQPHHSQGIYSVKHNKWISVPRRQRAKIDDSAVLNKYQDLGTRIENILNSRDHEQLARMMNKIKDMRSAGLEREGEFGVDNIVFKLLRNNGLIKRLVDARSAARDAELSLTERKRKKKKSRVRYGYGGYWTPGFDFGGTELGAGGDGGGESINESVDTAQMLKTCFKDIVKDLGIKSPPRMILHSGSKWRTESGSFGQYRPDDNVLHLAVGDRHVMDIIRTMAHELTHCRQNEIKELPSHAGKTGSPWEDEANAMAGRILRDMANRYPDLFETDTIDEGWQQRLGGAALAAACAVGAPGCATTGGLDAATKAAHAAHAIHALKNRDLKGAARAGLEQELRNYERAQRGDANAQNLSRIYQAQRRAQQNESSGYIPTAKEKNDPRFVMALSPDVRPGATGKNANKMALKTDAQGRPQVAKANGLVESLKQDLARFKTAEDYSADAPPGPETPPTMPAGTVRVGVSDVYDWYKLGQHIPNLKGLGKHDFGAGPPDSIISFGDEETEHKFIQDLEKTGLDVIDVDPADPAQPAGMRRIKTDPTYNVSESLQQEFELLEQEFLGEINMSPSNLKKLVRDIDARAGIEFEMIVPDINVEDDEDDLEMDMDSDERVRDIDDVIRFFDDGDYNSARDIRDLREEMYGQFEEWRSEQIYEKWQEEGQDYLRDWIFNNDLFDRDEAQTQAREEIAQANPDMPTDSDEFQDLVTNRVDEMADQFVISALEDQDNGYDAARESFDEEYLDTFDEGEWLASENIRYASDVRGNFDISWPYYRSMGGGDAKMDIDQVADDFSQAIGRPVNASSQYHGGRREPGHYVVEPDGSLEPDDPSDGGLEFVSPPLPLDELISDMQKVRAWAKKRGCYTSKAAKTGLHMNVSVPGTSIAKLDYVKLALLLGDEYVLNEFGRSANTYAKSAMGKIRDILKNKPQAANEVMEKMRGHMEALATKAIHTGNTDKYTSINTKDNYVEFRSPGDDYLDENWDKVLPTLMRTVVALDAAMDPNKYREEYQKKLYKLLDSSKQGSASPGVNKLLSMYFASDNETNSRELAVKLAKEILSRKDLEKQAGTPGKQFWWSVQKGNDRIEVVAGTEGVALDVAAEEWGLSGADRMPNATATILRPYVAPPAQTANGRWGIWISDASKFTVGDGKIRRWASKEDAELWLKLRRESQPNTRADLEVREIPNDYQQPGRVETDQQQTYIVHNGRYNTNSFQAPSREAAIDHFRNNWDQTGTFQLRSSTDEVIYNPAQTQTNAGEWGVWVPSLDRYATIGNAGPRRFETEAAAQAWIEDYHQRNAGRDLNLQASKIVNTFKAFDVGNGNTLGTFRASGPKGSQPANIAFSQYIQSLGRTNTAGYDYDEAEPLPDLFPDIPQQPAASRPAADELPEVPLDIEIERAPRTLTTPGQPQQTFSGEWKIVDADGQELHRFGGVGNAQADANATAVRWLQQNPRHMQAGVEVVPVMSE